jgi:histidinol-phosphate aminotransferase
MTINIRPRRSLLNPELKRPSALSSTPRDAGTLWLDKNENLDPALLELSRAVLSELPATAVATYPEAGELYRKLARWVGVSPDSLLLTPGSDGAIRLAFEAFVEHGEDVVHSSPTFAMYPVYSQMFGAKAHPIEYQRIGDGPCLDPQAVVDAVLRWKPKLTCLPNPDSPTGTTLAPEDLRRILDACEAVGSVFLLDEAYHPFHEWSAVSWTAASRHLIVARTFAKAWGAAGLRIGYAVAHPETIALLHKMRPMYEVSTFAVEFMSRLLERPGDMERTVARIREGKAHFVDRMRSLGFTVLPTSGNFLHVAFGERGGRIHAALGGKVLYRASFDHPCLAGYSRFSVAPKPIMSRVADLIQEAVKK